MAFHTFNERSFEAWQRGMRASYKRPGWDQYDAVVQQAVNAFNRFNYTKAGYIAPRWELIKAILWVEGGGPVQKLAWNNQPMQIGVVIQGHADPGIFDVVSKPTAGMVTPPEIRRNFDLVTIRTNPTVNIQAGLALLHMKMAFWSRQHKSELRPPSLPTQRLSELPSTPPVHNRRAALATPAPHRAQWEEVILGWRIFNPVTVYQQYNVGDEAYAAKLEYCMELMRQS